MVLSGGRAGHCISWALSCSPNWGSDLVLSEADPCKNSSAPLPWAQVVPERARLLCSGDTGTGLLGCCPGHSSLWTRFFVPKQPTAVVLSALYRICFPCWSTLSQVVVLHRTGAQKCPRGGTLTVMWPCRLTVSIKCSLCTARYWGGARS